MIKDHLAALKQLIADTTADMSAANTFWTAGELAKALAETGRIVLIDREGLRERVARSLQDMPCMEDWDELGHEDQEYMRVMADAAIAAILGEKPA